MRERVDLYDSHYGKGEADVYRAIRSETYGEDLGQASWITADECDRLCAKLALGPGTSVLEVACGAGGIATRIAERFGASVVGVDVNAAGVEAATCRAAAHGTEDRVRFQVVDADAPLPFPDGSFDAVFCNDAINHLKDRDSVLAEWGRVLRPGGRCLYTDPIVVTGFLSRVEIVARSSIGFFLFAPLGANEACLDGAGFEVTEVLDLTESVATTADRWRRSRADRREELRELEGGSTFDDLQRFLDVVRRLAAERRLSRFAFLGIKR